MAGRKLGKSPGPSPQRQRFPEEPAAAPAEGQRFPHCSELLASVAELEPLAQGSGLLRPPGTGTLSACAVWLAEITAHVVLVHRLIHPPVPQTLPAGHRALGTE